MNKIFSIWPRLSDMAREIGANPIAVRHWKRRGSIPGEYDVEIVRAAGARGHSLTFQELAEARAVRKSGNPDCPNDHAALSNPAS